ncbi:MAG: hypothetical protein JO197_05560 [Acidobacteria bacterium]|nr:hypothetical protein [Acidobacteriota bacterium]MBV9475996.1 hypothetical protein [Acidobacteriota bacterium]
MRRWTVPIAAISLLLTGASALADGEPAAVLVPWKLLVHDAHEVPGDAALVLYWVPASPDELRHAALLASAELVAASHCVAMRVVRSDDAEMLERLDVEQLPVAVLADGDGHVVARIESRNGVLGLADVESMVRKALERQRAAAEEALDDAAKHADAGERDAAVVLYERVAKQRCICPRQARDAQRALRKIRQ